MRICTKCHNEKPETEFFVKDKSKNRLHSQCKDCYREHRSIFYAQHYAKHADAYRLRAKHRREKLKNIFRNNMLVYLSGKRCALCDESDIRVLEFDHLDPSTKTFAISQAVRLGYSWEEVLKEMEKCRILCANCHKKHTASQANWYKNL